MTGPYDKSINDFWEQRQCVPYTNQLHGVLLPPGGRVLAQSITHIRYVHNEGESVEFPDTHTYTYLSLYPKSRNGPGKQSPKMVQGNGPGKWSPKMVQGNGPVNWSQETVTGNRSGKPSQDFNRSRISTIAGNSFRKMFQETVF